MVATKEAVKSTSVVEPAGRLKGKVALITGGTRGLGLAIAKAYAREGAKIVIASRTPGELKLAVDEIKALGADVTAAKIDLNGQAACEGLYNGAIRSYGKIDVLVNNASIPGPRTPILTYSGKDWTAVMRLNLDVVFWLSKAALGTMIPSNGGCIINVSAAVAQQGQAKWGAYSVAKAGVVNLTQILAEEVAQYNIRVNAVDPGQIRSESAPTAPAADDVVNPFLYLASDASKGVTGLQIEAADWIGRSF
jgi:NAD(P)-dependent dehydrogenase (short-subunit alcohol dehydrogenase family)